MSGIKYRDEIDGLRAFAVLAVIFCHMGFLPNGYLGVDIFFAISGYLITAIVYKESLNNKFSIVEFYLRRIRRIIPLVIFTTSIALLIGLFVLLPYDLKNLSHSVIGTNFFLNNVVQFITSASYWDLSNDYKPLMHTWSLAVEEQFYMFFPIIFLIFKGKYVKYVSPTLTILAILSFIYFLTSNDRHSKFYLIQYRFYELSLGGIAAIFFKEKKFNHYYSLFFLTVITLLLFFKLKISADLQLTLMVAASIGLLVSGNNNHIIVKRLLENRLLLFIGKISFSLYMWHQIILAYCRYIYLEKIGFNQSVVLLILIFILSTLTYHYIEQPARNKEKVKTKYLLIILVLLTIATSSLSFYLYKVKGIIKDVPELGIYKTDLKKNIKFNGQDYNDNIFNFDVPFASKNKIKVLVIGNSYARDFVNVLLESKYGNNIEISYTKDIYACKDVRERITNAKYIFFSTLDIKLYNQYKNNFQIDDRKVWNVGVKNFGWNNGIFYNKKRDENYCLQRTKIRDGLIEQNNAYAKDWKNKYINLLTLLIDKNVEVPVFTPDCKFISHDCLHLTQAGARYLAGIVKLDDIFKN